jgi:hypothetical protein
MRPLRHCSQPYLTTSCQQLKLMQRSFPPDPELSWRSVLAAFATPLSLLLTALLLGSRGRGMRSPVVPVGSSNHVDGTWARTAPSVVAAAPARALQDGSDDGYEGWSSCRKQIGVISGRIVAIEREAGRKVFLGKVFPRRDSGAIVLFAWDANSCWLDSFVCIAARWLRSQAKRTMAPLSRRGNPPRHHTSSSSSKGGPAVENLQLAGFDMILIQLLL